MTLEERIEALSRACCVAVGADPDRIVPETGYSDARQIPRWWKEVEWACRFVAMQDADSHLSTPKGEVQTDG